MSREIKFRVWNKTIKRMCDWDDIKTGADFNDLEDDNGEWMPNIQYHFEEKQMAFA